MEEVDLTICSVSYKSRKYININRRFAEKLNHFEQLKWIIVDNAPFEQDNCIQPPLNGALVIKGNRYNPTVRRPASYQHGLALNKALQMVETRFVLILDPDFFIIRKNWACEIPEYMKNNQIAFLGAPWNPKWFTKYRYFPCVHCLFIDLSQVDPQAIDFTPETNPITDTPFRSVRSILSPFVPDIIRKLVLARQAVGQSDDTGFRLYRRFYQHSTLMSECLTPVFKPEQDLEVYNSRLMARFLLFERFLPERFSYIPKKKGFFTQTGFRELGYPDTRSRNWEEFIWKGEPFAFHVRGFMQRNRDPESELNEIKSLIEIITN